MAKTLRDYGLNSDAVLGTPEATQFLVAQGKPPTTVSTSLAPLNTGIGSGSTGTGSQTVIPPVGSGSSTPVVTPPVNTPPTGLFGATPPATGNFQFANVLQTAVDRLGTNNELMKQKNLLVKALYDAPLSPDELKMLPPQIQAQVASFNAKSPDPAMRANLEMQLRLTNDSIAGRNSTMNQSIKFLTEEYGKSATNLEKQRQDAIANVLDFAKVYGPNTKAALKSLYGQDYLDQLKAQGIDIDSFSGTPVSTDTKPASAKEFEYAVGQGYKGTYLQFRAEGIAGENGLNGKQTQNFIAITNKFQADPFINNAIKGQTAIQVANQVLADPGNAPNQLKALYTLVKSLDPDSAVREGELALAEKTQSYLQKFNTSITRISEGQIISPQAASDLATAAKELATAWVGTADKRTKQYKAQATGAGILDAFNEYLGTSELEFGDETGGSDKSSVLSDIQDDIRTLSKQMTREQLAQELANDYTELTPAQIQGIIYKALPNGWEKNGIQDVNEIPEIVGGYDITSYATDPKHGEKVASIFEGIPNIVTAKDAESYIKKIAPDSPVTGQSVIASSQKTKVDPKMILAIMQQDSTFGTAGKAIRTKNPGNVGNDDTGKLVTYEDWSKGVLAVAKNLAWRKIT